MKEVAGGRLALAAAAVPFLVFLADRQDLVALFARHTGFYRPLVALSFAADYAAFGNRPLGYGLTDLSLAIACAALIYLLLRSLLLSAYASVAGSALWLLNFHGIDMAVLWTSGRTALLLVLTSVAAGAAPVSEPAALRALFGYFADPRASLRHPQRAGPAAPGVSCISWLDGSLQTALSDPRPYSPIVWVQCDHGDTL